MDFEVFCSRRVLWLFIIMMIVGCMAGTAACTGTHSAQQTATMTPSLNNAPLRYLALGDSYTIGARVAVPDRWPNQLVAALRQSGVIINDPEIIAQTGWTTDELAEGIAQVQPEGPYDLVSLLIGVNNQYRGLDPEAYRNEFVSLLETAVRLAGNNPSRVFVVSIPDWSVTPFAQSRDREEVSAAIDAFNEINRLETEGRDVIYIDITPVSRQALKNNALIAEDTLHPSGEMYRLWVAQIEPAVSGLLIQK